MYVCWKVVSMYVCWKYVSIYVCLLKGCIYVCMLKVCIYVCMLKGCINVCMLKGCIYVCMLKGWIYVCMLKGCIYVCMLKVMYEVKYCCFVTLKCYFIFRQAINLVTPCLDPLPPSSSALSPPFPFSSSPPLLLQEKQVSYSL